MTERSEGYHAALASTSRRQVLDALLDSPEPLDAAAVAGRLGLHVTTARFHLDQLTAAGLASRRSGEERRRGRPRVLYAPAGPAREEDSREQLIHVLANALAHEDDTVPESVRAGRRWADAFAPADLSDPAPGLVTVLERLGFDPERDPGTDQDEPAVIRLRSCPFRDAARAHPEVVCSVHRGLIEQLLDRTPAEARLVPFAEPQLCLVTLTPRPVTASTR